MRSILRDLRFAQRALVRTPAVTATAVLSITIAIAASTAVFSVVDATLLRPPPFSDPARLVVLYVTRRTPERGEQRERWSWPQIGVLRRRLTSLESLGSVTQAVVTLGGEEPEPLNAELISSSYLATLGIAPEAGRALVAAEDSGAGAHPVAIIAHDLWVRRFGGERRVLGRPIQVNGVTLVVIGVLPPGFAGLGGRAQLWMPATMAPRVTYPGYLTTDQSFITVVGRRRDGVSLEHARAELAVVGREVQRVSPSESDAPQETLSATAVSLADARIDPSTRRPVLLLAGAVVCLLLLSCVNVANLLLGRAASRRREMAVRVAIGASRGRLVQQLLVEAAVIAGVATALGVTAARVIAGRLALPEATRSGHNFYGAIGEFATPHIDVRAVAFAAGLCVMVTGFFGLVPAWRGAQADITTSLKNEVPTSSGRGARLDARRVIIAMEVALATLLLVTGGLLTASYHRLRSAPVGFDPTHLLTFALRPSDATYPPARAPELIDRVLEEIERTSGVEAATVDGCAPVGTGCANSTLFIVGRPAPPPDRAPGVLRHYVGPHHFRTLGVPLLRGRSFDEHDRAESERVVIINQTAARRFWPSEEPIGQRVWFGGGSSFDRPDSSATIVGIVGDVAYQPLDERPMQPGFYTPYAQFTYAARTVLVRTVGDPAGIVPAVRAAVHRAEPTLALFDVRTMEQRALDSAGRRAYETLLIAAFAASALVLAATGIFAVITHVVGERRREIGIRAALGAGPRQILAVVARHAMGPSLAGVVIGGAASIAVSRVFAATLYETSALDPLVLGIVVTGVIAVALAATLLPARRALRIDPAEAMRAW